MVKQRNAPKRNAMTANPIQIQSAVNLGYEVLILINGEYYEWENQDE